MRNIVLRSKEQMDFPFIQELNDERDHGVMLANLRKQYQGNISGVEYVIMGEVLAQHDFKWYALYWVETRGGGEDWQFTMEDQDKIALLEAHTGLRWTKSRFPFEVANQE